MMGNGGVIDTMISIVIHHMFGLLWLVMKFVDGIGKRLTAGMIKIVGTKMLVYQQMDLLDGMIMFQLDS